MQLVLQPSVHDFPIGFEPVRERRRLPHQLSLAPPGHGAERSVHISDIAFEVEHAHAGQHRVFHRPAKIGFGDQRLLRLQPAPGMAPGANQHPGCQRTERTDQPEQAIADQARRRSVRLRAQQQPVADRRHRNFVLVGVISPRQHAGTHLARIHLVASDQLALGISQRDGITRADFCRNAIAQQTVDGKLAEHGTGKQALIEKRNVQLQHLCRISASAGLREHGLPEFPRQRVVALGVAGPQHLADGMLLRRVHAGRSISGLEAPSVVDPADGLQLRELADQRFRATDEFRSVDFVIRGIAGDAHQLLLAFEQAQPKALLGVFDIAPDRLLLTPDFLGPQIPESRDDGSQEQQDGGQRGQHGQRVLQRWSLPAPPPPPPRDGGRVDGTASGSRGRNRHVCEFRGSPHTAGPEGHQKRFRLIGMHRSLQKNA